MYLTQSAEVSEGRIYVTAIKGVNVNESDWRDATLEEKEVFDNARRDREKEIM